MKTRTVILLSILFASAASALTVFLPELITVSADNARRHRITVVFSYTTDAYGEEVRSDQRYVAVKVPTLQADRQLKEMSLLLKEQGRHSSVPLAFTVAITNAETSLSMDIAHIRDSIVFARYANPRDKSDLGVEYLINLGTFLSEDKR